MPLLMKVFLVLIFTAAGEPPQINRIPMKDMDQCQMAVMQKLDQAKEADEPGYYAAACEVEKYKGQDA